MRPDNDNSNSNNNSAHNDNSNISSECATRQTIDYHLRSQQTVAADQAQRRIARPTLAPQDPLGALELARRQSAVSSSVTDLQTTTQSLDQIECISANDYITIWMSNWLGSDNDAHDDNGDSQIDDHEEQGAPFAGHRVQK